MNIIVFFFLFFDFLFFKVIYINCNESIECFEYSCKKCNSSEFGTCTECRDGFELIDGTCPCFDYRCALCITSDYSNICLLCKNGYINNNNYCISNIDNCDVQKDNKCLFCYDGYVYNWALNICEKETKINKRHCADSNCAICLSEEEGTCEECNKGYKLVKGKCCQPSSESTCVSNTNPYSINCTIECAVCHSDGECIFCRQGYYLKNGVCQSCINGCSHCASSTKCQYCFSQYELTNTEICQKKNNSNIVDFNVNLYMKKKYELIKYLYNDEYDETKAQQYQNTPECDSHCSQCDQNISKCLKCNPLYVLDEDNNNCTMQCSDENCLSCSLTIFKAEQCNICKNGYYSSGKNCYLKCSDENCRYCKMLDGQEICIECFPNYKLEGISCKSKSNYMAIIYAIIVILILVIFIIFFCYYKQKQIQQRHEFIRNRMSQHNLNNMTVYNRNGELESSGRKQLTKEEIMDEFEKQKINAEKGYEVCQFCKKKPGKYKCDCDCVVCKEHSLLKKVEGEGEENKVCFNCGKIVKKVTPIKQECNICFEKKINLVHFQCNCALLVCKECYVKCKMESDKCPGCRAKI